MEIKKENSGKEGKRFFGMLFYTSQAIKDIFTELNDFLDAKDLAIQEKLQELRNESTDFLFSLPQCYVIFGEDFLRVYLGHKIDRDVFANGAGVSFEIIKKPGDTFLAHKLELAS